ncbi:oligosaccharide flippase family protein, partial [bacterium]|nr:oligosaccharide flippase family protein [bacterium]
VFILSGYAIHVSLAHLLLPLEYGLFGVILGMVTVVRVLLGSGISQATSRFIAHDEEHAYAIFRTSRRAQRFLALAITALYIGGIPLWIRYLNDPTLAPYLLLSAVLVPLMGDHPINMAYFNGRRMFGRQAFFIGLYSAGRFFFAILLVLAGWKVYGAVAGFALAIVPPILLSRLQIHKTDDTFRFPLRSLIPFAAPLVVTSVGISLLLNLDLLLLKHYHPTDVMIGHYTGATNLAKSPYWLLFSFSLTLLPIVSRGIRQGNAQRVGKLIRRNLTFLLLMALPGGAVALNFPAEILDLLYPKEFASAASAFQILYLSMTLLALQSALSACLTAKGHPVLAMTIVLMSLVTQFVAAPFLIPSLGMTGTALGHFLAVSAGTLLAAILVFAHFGAFLEWKRFAKGLLAAGLSWLALALLPPLPLWGLLVAIPLAFVVFAVALWLLGGIGSDDLRVITSGRREPPRKTGN